MLISKKYKNKTHIPQPSLLRLCSIYALLEEMQETGEKSISSTEIGRRLGVGSHNIRKDMGFIDEAGISGAGYEIKKIKAGIEETLGFNNTRNACIIGLGNLGSLMINNHAMPLPCISIVAGFDSNINILETVQTSIPVYPTYEIPSVLKHDNIELAIITEKDRNMEAIIERLQQGGIKVIMNFSTLLISSPDESVYIRNIDIFTEFRYVSAILSINDNY
jgi:redox-sensing transcriptional repressor